MRLSRRAQDTELTEKLTDLLTTREDVEAKVMFGGKDSSDEVCGHLRDQYEWVKKDVIKMCKDNQRTQWQKLVNRIPRNSTTEKQRLQSGRIQDVKESYQGSSRLRRSFQQISTFAFMREPPFRTDAYCRVRATEWKVVFSLVPTPEPSAWVILGYEDPGFEEWWEHRLTYAELDVPARQEWKHIKALYGGIVLLLELLLSHELKGTPLDSNFANLLNQIKIIGSSLSGAMNFPEYFLSISAFFGSLCPLVYIALKCVKSIKAEFVKHLRDGIGDLQATADFYLRQVINLELLAEILVGQSMELPKAQKKFKLTAIPEVSSEHNTATDDAASESALLSLNALPKYDFRVLERLGLRQFTLSSAKGRQIGFGSYSAVHSRYNPDGDEQFAIKEPFAEAGHDAIWNRVGREAEIWSSLVHDNILPLRGFFLLPGDVPALVMDICENNLKDYVYQSTSLSKKKRLELLLEVAKALEYLHSRKIAHGDLRASNVLVKMNETGTRRTAVLGDFGASYFVDREFGPRLDDSIFQTTRGQIGNPNWLSPELLRKAISSNKHHGADKTCISLAGDIYSFGCVFLEVIYKRDPYQSFEDDEEKKRKKLEGHLPATLAETCETYHPFLSLLWHSDPNQRPSAKSVVSEVDRFCKLLQ